MLHKEIGIVRKDDKMLCEKCKADLSIENSVTFTGYWSNDEECVYSYSCNQCNNNIEQVLSVDLEGGRVL